MAQLKTLSIRGFKSIEKLENFEPGALNVLIGANGSGKSNFVEFFRLLGAIRQKRLQLYMKRNAPADGYFHKGIKQTPHIEADLSFGEYCDYHIRLAPTTLGNVLIEKEFGNVPIEIEKESGKWHGPSGPGPFSGREFAGGLESQWWTLGVAPPPMQLFKPGGSIATNRYDPNAPLSPPSWQVYHFHDTSSTAGMRRDVGVYQSNTLESNGDNLAAFLWHLRNEYVNIYELLQKMIQRVMPYFLDFSFSKKEGKNEELVRLTWRQKDTDYIFQPGHFSDGTLRYICLATVLLQPFPPDIIVLDEPELGLHPEALSVLGGLIRSASARMQIILATQSPVLVNEFEPEQIITVDAVDGATRFNRLDAASLSDWLNDFTVGELWQKGTIRGGVNHA